MHSFSAPFRLPGGLRLLPQTTFIPHPNPAQVKSGSLEGTVFSRVLPGEYIQAGQQGGGRRMGGLVAPPGIVVRGEEGVGSRGAGAGWGGSLHPLA